MDCPPVREIIHELSWIISSYRRTNDGKVLRSSPRTGGQTMVELLLDIPPYFPSFLTKGKYICDILLRLWTLKCDNT